jgi:hypothetical protein
MVFHGTVWDLSAIGSLFLPRTAVKAKPGMHGRLHIGAAGHLQPQVRIARVVDVQTSSIPAVRGVGLEFMHLTHADREAIEHLLSAPAPAAAEES